VSGYDIQVSGWSADSSGARSVTASCSGGRVVLGGGFDTARTLDLGDIVITRSSPNGNDAWTVEATSLGTSFAIRAYAICARAG
jgi:hypothetical protein